MIFKGYWKVALTRPEIPLGSKRAIRCPSPGFEKDAGKGEVAMVGLSMHDWGNDRCK